MTRRLGAVGFTAIEGSFAASPGTLCPSGPVLTCTPTPRGVGVQVNTGPDGHNVPGDAANEPSIAVNPTAPNRLVIAWRQFDSVASNFRQAGYAFSRDGGCTWRAGRLEPGI